MKENKKVFWKKAGVVCAAIVAVMVIGSSIIAMVSVNPERKKDDDLEWVEIATISSDDFYKYMTGEASPAGEGWLSTFCLDYGQDPGTVLADNATDWSADANTRGYVDTDDTDTDLKSEDPFYFCIRARFDTDVKDGADFIGSRCKCALTVSGDETISGVEQVGDQSDTTGGGVVSQNDSGDSYIWINFYWDDNSDGYRITDDGSLDWSITLSEKK